MYTTGSRHLPAMLSDSWNVPSFDAPSPKKHRTTASFFCMRQARPAPVPTGMLPPTMPVAPRLRFETSAMCIDPPRPLQ